MPRPLNTSQLLRIPLTLFGDVLTTLFPADCRCCDGPLDHADLVPVCARCTQALATLHGQQTRQLACWQCGETLETHLDLEDLRFAAQMQTSLQCRSCRMVPPAFDHVLSLAGYDRELRTLIQLFKFERLPGLARVLGDRMADTLLALEPNDLLVIAVPLFKTRERERGYNQSVLLANRAIKRLRQLEPGWTLTPAHHLLTRVRRTEAQYLLTQRERRRNLRHAFAVTGNVAGRSILLVDDILTSGATARECARVLKAAGAASILVVTLARAQKHALPTLPADGRPIEPGDDSVAWTSPTTTQPPPHPSTHAR